MEKKIRPAPKETFPIFPTPQHLASWESSVLNSLARPLEYNFTRPQRSFRYPNFPQLPVEYQSDPMGFLKDFLHLKHKVYPRFFSNALKAFKFAFPQSIDPSKIAIVGSALSDYSHLHPEEPTLLSRDPDDWESIDFSQFSGVLLSNPHQVDGFYFPPEHYNKLYQRIRERNPHCRILSDERLYLARYSILEAGSLRSKLKTDPNLYLVNSVYPVSCPAGPELSWVLNSENLQKTASQELLDAFEVDYAARAVLSFEGRGGPSYVEFQRRMLTTVHGLKMLGTALNEGLVNKRIQVPLWPEAGFHLVINIAPLLRELGCPDAETWARQLAQDHGLLVNPGRLWGRPHEIQICFAASTLWVEKFAEALKKAIK